MVFGRIGRVASVAGVIAVAYACSSTSSSNTTTEPCNPGEAVACRTPEGCTGEKVCKPDGLGYEACACGTGGSGGDASGGSKGSGGSTNSGGSKGSGGAQGGSSSGDAGETGTSGSGGDAGSGSGPCDLSAPFGLGTRIEGLGTMDSEEVDAFLTGDLRTIYYASRSTGVWELAMATRAGQSGAFANVIALDVFNTGENKGAPTLTANERTIFFASQDLTGWDIYSATRMSTADPFLQAQPVISVNSGNWDWNPFILPNGSVIYFASTRLAGLSAKIFRSAVVGGDFEEPVLAQGVNDNSATDSRPVLTPDELTIYFSSDRADDAAQGAEDIWTASRSSTGEPFGSLRIVEELNSPLLDEPSWISPDGCTLVYHSMTTGTRHVYVAQKP